MSEQIISPGVFTNENDQSLVTQGTTVTGLAIVGPTVGGVPLVPTVVTSYSDFLSKFGDIFQSGSYYYEYLTSLAVNQYFNAGGQSVLVTKIISGSGYTTFANAYVPQSGSNSSSSLSSSFQLENLVYGADQNNSGSVSSNGALALGTSNNIRWEVTTVNTSSGLFTLTIREGDDNTNNKIILETWANLSLDPQQPNYINRVIGDQRNVYSSTTNYLQLTGTYPVNSQYVRIVPNSTYVTPNSLDNNGNYLSASYSQYLPNLGSGSINGAFSGGIAATNRLASFFSNITSTSGDCQGFVASDYTNALNLLTNKDEFDFNLLLVPGVTLDSGPLSSLASTAIAVCQGRTDSMMIIDDTCFGAPVQEAATAATANNSNYAATYYPWVQIYSSNLGQAVWVPPSVVMAGAYAFNDQVAAAWFAPAGINRGGLNSVIRAERRLAQTDRDTLYSANVNPIATFPNVGIVAWGQKTLQKNPTSLDRVNVRRLLITLKRFLSQTALTLVFEQNTQTTRNKFLSVAEPYLESIVQRQGLYAYKVVMDNTNNTSDVIDRNQMVGQIWVQPTKTAEFVILNFTITPTGASFS
jgi:hypothetical protein